MKQTATALSSRQTIIINEIPVLAVANTDDLLTNTGLDSLWNDKAFYKPSSQLRYDDRVQISFSVDKKYEKHFILIKGLIEFHRSSHFIFTFNKLEQTFNVRIDVSDFRELSEFLPRISAWLDQEIQFKAGLKKAIEFEKSYKSSMRAFYGSQEGTTYRNSAL